VQTLTHRSCARSLHRAACDALLVIALGSFAVPATAVSTMGLRRRGVVDRRYGGGRPNLRLQRPCFAAGSSGWRKRVIPLGGWRATTRIRIRYSDSARCAA